MLSSKRLARHTRKNVGIVDSKKSLGRKRRMPSMNDKYQVGILDGTEIGKLRGYSFRGTITAGDGSNPNGGQMGAWYVNQSRIH